MGLWLLESLPALILVLSFIRFSFRQFSALWVCLTSYIPQTTVNERWGCGWRRACRP